MTICKYYLEGRCKFGNACQNEHRQPYGGNQRNTRSDIYDRISYGENNKTKKLVRVFVNISTTTNNKLYDERSVRADLTKDRPIYRYSVYGPAKEEPNLIDGTDYSPEELRLQYYIIMGTVGCDISYVCILEIFFVPIIFSYILQTVSIVLRRQQNGVKDLENRTQTQIDSCLKDLRNSLSRFESQKQQQSSFESFGSGGNTFGQPQPPQGFGVPQQNTFGNQASAFGVTPTFGQNTIGFPETQQGFGINAMSGSGFGQNAAGGFGVQTQTFGGFGQPAQPDPQQLYQQQGSNWNGLRIEV
ncbi:2832_t:CDS:2 [Cetraspora pellucida]|uniref:2832_t:CDS:1 n=1 Tax=Cetraspora pellucida TaxID=1433469 RepID=A0A9N9AD28_9GLOM|nr:2832_t:CDS:2 [Cetraspora pellucida]